MDENKNNGTQQNGQDPQTVPVPEAEENRMPDQAEQDRMEKGHRQTPF